MIAADFLHASVHGLVLSGVSFRLLSPCRRACSARAFAPHFALSPVQPPHVQTSCLEYGWPTAIAVFAVICRFSVNVISVFAGLIS